MFRGGPNFFFWGGGGKFPGTPAFQNARLPFQNVLYFHVTCHVWAMKLTCFRGRKGMFGFYVLYLLYKSQTFRSKCERVSISLFKLSTRPVKNVFFKRLTYVSKRHAASLNANRSNEIIHKYVCVQQSSAFRYNTVAEIMLTLV